MPTDPKELPVQLNIQVPWRYREFLRAVADANHKSLSELVRDCLYEKHPQYMGGPADGR